MRKFLWGILWVVIGLIVLYACFNLYRLYPNIVFVLVIPCIVGSILYFGLAWIIFLLSNNACILLSDATASFVRNYFIKSIRFCLITLLIVLGLVVVHYYLHILFDFDISSWPGDIFIIAYLFYPLWIITDGRDELVSDIKRFRNNELLDKEVKHITPYLWTLFVLRSLYSCSMLIVLTIYIKSIRSHLELLGWYFWR